MALSLLVSEKSKEILNSFFKFKIQIAWYTGSLTKKFALEKSLIYDL